MFADLGFPNAEEELVKAAALSTTQPQVSALMLPCWKLLGQDVEITVRPKGKDGCPVLAVR